MDFGPLIESKIDRFKELEEAIASASLFENPRKAREIMREHARLKQLLEDWENLKRTKTQIAENEELTKSDDEEIAELAQVEIPELAAQAEEIERRIQISLLPPEPNEDRDAIVEIRAGTGGNEAALFAADLHRMYGRYAEIVGWKIEELEASPSELGGLKEVTFRISGDAVFRSMRYESGVHRVQRVPATEAQGRIHTSTATVAVLPEAEEVDLELKPEEVRVEVCRAGGPGGQGVNTTDSAVQVMHIPTGRIVRCQDSRSQQKNKEKALNILRSRLLEAKQQEEAEKYSTHRRNLIGSGGREEKVRTYNFPQNRVTDHRVGLTLYNLDSFMEGNIGEMVEALQASDMQARLEEAGMAV